MANKKIEDKDQAAKAEAALNDTAPEAPAAAAAPAGSGGNGNGKPDKYGARISKEEVRKAMDELRAGNCKCTVPAIRAALGNRGSNSTIQKYMNEINDEDLKRLEELNADKINDTAVSTLAHNLSTRAYLVVCQELKDRITDIAAFAQRALNENRENMEKTAQQLDQTEKERDEYREKAAELEKQLSESQNTVAELKRLRTDLEMQLKSAALEAKAAVQAKELKQFIEGKVDEILKVVQTEK
ncbi:MAG: DNA-binding protein [Proteobacteria bacterium]|uniref:DNA-binding protein n=1 Tax=Candidatus Avisuccinivibrio stercorigallinarum TaxID=2840704 RepID=A0A9D9D7W1_9GAMM|nr:DNA-binding protein [Candidatus Avisuccinivibrio stercorigallinarum]